MLALTRLIDRFTAISYTTVLLGDFNVPEIDWFNLSFKQNKLNSILVNCILTNAMSQFVNTPSRSSCDCDNILDLIFSNDPYSISIADNIPPLGTSDHDIIQFSIFLPDVSDVLFDCKPLPDVRSIDDSLLHEPSIIGSIDPPIYNWNDADYRAINEQLCTFDWHSIFGFNFDVESLWRGFKSVVWPIIEMFVPRKLIHHLKKYKTRLYPKNIRQLLIRKAAVWRALKLSGDAVLRDKYTKLANQCRLAIIKFDIGREERLLRTNILGAFYRFINKKLSSRSGIAPLVDSNGNLISSDFDKANNNNNNKHSIYKAPICSLRG